MDLPTISLVEMSDSDYLNKSAQIIGPVKKIQHNLLAKDTFIRVFKYTGDFAKLKSADLKRKA